MRSKNDISNDCNNDSRVVLLNRYGLGLDKNGAAGLPSDPPPEGEKYFVFFVVFTGFHLTDVPIYIIMGLTKGKIL